MRRGLLPVKAIRNLAVQADIATTLGPHDPRTVEELVARISTPELASV
jgi:hypothetical protein